MSSPQLGCRDLSTLLRAPIFSSWLGCSQVCCQMPSFHSHQLAIMPWGHFVAPACSDTLQLSVLSLTTAAPHRVSSLNLSPSLLPWVIIGRVVGSEGPGLLHQLTKKVLCEHTNSPGPATELEGDQSVTQAQKNALQEEKALCLGRTRLILLTLILEIKLSGLPPCLMFRTTFHST